MVLFLEAEILRLLELDAALRADPSNISKNGVLLKQSAREQLTASLNRSFPHKQPWTENQVAVKFKNLRGEYAEYKWLSAQPGFHADGTGMSEEWWQNAKRLRPKCHAFKGKLPWVFEAHMKEVVGDGGPDYSQEQPVKSQLKEKEPKEKEPKEKEQREEEVETEDTVATKTSTLVETSSNVVAIPPPRHKRKRSDDESEDSVEPRSNRVSTREQEREQGSSATTARDDVADGYNYSRSLGRSVEQSSVAAAGMARGFQDLITIFQQQSAKCRELEQQLTECNTNTPSLVLAEQRSVLLAIARSLEQSTRATADMAQGYRELVKAFVRGSDRTLQQREC